MYTDSWRWVDRRPLPTASPSWYGPDHSKNKADFLAYTGPKDFEAIPAARIIGIVDDGQLTARRAADIAAADFSRIRRADLGRFTIDRLMTILDRLDQEVDVTVSVRPRPKGDSAERALHP